MCRRSEQCGLFNVYEEKDWDVNSVYINQINLTLVDYRYVNKTWD